MAEINCSGDCTTCKHLKNGEVNPAECASIWGFMGVQKLHANMERMHSEIMGAIGALTGTSKPIPGIEYEDEPSEAAAEAPIAESAETPAAPEVKQ